MRRVRVSGGRILIFPLGVDCGERKVVSNPSKSTDGFLQKPIQPSCLTVFQNVRKLRTLPKIFEASSKAMKFHIS